MQSKMTILGTLVLSLGLTLGVYAGEDDTTELVPHASSKTKQNDPVGKIPSEIEKAMRMPAGKERDKALNSAALEWVQQDPMAALAWAYELPSSFNDLYQSVIGRCGEKCGRTMAEWFLQKKSWGGLHYAMDYWGRAEPAAALEWSMQAPDEVRHIAFSSMAKGMALKDPEAATNWFLKVKLLEDRRSMAYGVCRGWAYARPKDVSAATTWALGLQSKEERISALYGIGNTFGRLYPLPATTAVIKALKNKEEVRAAAYGVVKAIQSKMVRIPRNAVETKDADKKSAASYDRAFAKEWLDPFPLSDSEKTDILNGPNIASSDRGKIPWPQ